MIELSTKLIGCFGVKKTKTQVKKITRIGNLWATKKNHTIVGSITFSSNKNLSFQVVLNDSKFARVKRRQREWIF